MVLARALGAKFRECATQEIASQIRLTKMDYSGLSKCKKGGMMLTCILLLRDRVGCSCLLELVL